MSSPSLTPISGQLTALTSIRFFAAMWVVLYHFAPPHLKGAPQPMVRVVENGGLGVPLFFILSGFILSYTYVPRILAKGALDLRGFWIARFARIYPVYALAMLLALPSAAMLTLRHFGRSEGMRVLAVSGVLQTTLLQAWSPFYSGAAEWNTPSWSLSAEAFFYLTFPVVAIALARRTPRFAILIGVASLATVFAMQFGAVIVQSGGHIGMRADAETLQRVMTFNPLIRLPEFVLGACLGRWFLSATRTSWSGALVALPIMTLGVFLLWDSDSLLGAVNYTGRIASMAAIVTLSAGGAGLFSRVMGWAPLLLLGEASYTLYMIQRPFESYFRFFSERVTRTTMDQSDGLLGVYIALLIALSVFIFRTFETPLRRRIRDRLSPVKVVASASGEPVVPAVPR